MIENPKQTARAQQVRAQGLAHAVAQQVSGLTRQAYADRAGISVYKLDYWRTLARRLKANGGKPATVATTTTPSASRAVLVRPLFIEINRAVDTDLTASTSHITVDGTAHHETTSNLSICSVARASATPASLPIELHLGSAWQGHRLCLAATIDDAWLASLLRALPTHALSNALQQSALPPPSPSPSTSVAPSRTNGLATS